tara:strand:- start:20 stop:508 length:489 start_codon:yes stop_codon:yes gene_type:complete
MSFLANLFSGGATKLIDSVKNVVDEFNLSGEEKQDFVARMEGLLQQRDSEIEQTIRAELNAKMQIIVAELNQGDTFTKRARPTVIYFGLFAIFWNYMLVPTVQSLMGVDVNPFALPTEFWVAWGGITSTYVLGRSAEKRGTRNNVTDLMTGSGMKQFEGLLK